MVRRIGQGVTRLTGAGIVVLAISACGSASASPSPSAPSSPSRADDACEATELRAPDGSALDLTGTWSGFLDSVWVITQSGSCVAMEVLSNAPGEPLGAEYRFVFWGELASDFTVPGTAMCTWLDPSRTTDPTSPSIGQVRVTALGVSFDEDAHPEIEVDSRGFVNAPDPYTETLERISTSTELPSS